MFSETYNKMGTISLPIYTVDAFTDTAFSGNPAAVCFTADPKKVTDEQRQQIAAELKMTTAYLEPTNTNSSQTDNSFNLRWFTPETEISLCGHATLAAAAVLVDAIGNPNKEFIFSTKGGELRTRIENGLVVLNLPLSKTEGVDKDTLEPLLKALCPIDLVEDVSFSPELNDLLVRLKPGLSRAEFEAISPNISELLQHGKYRTLCLTTRAMDSQDEKGRPYDYFKRVFAPWIGINEDSVTGSSFTMTAPYWKNLLGKSNLYARQCSARGGDVSVNILDEKRLEIAGAAAINLKGSFSLY